MLIMHASNNGMNVIIVLDLHDVIGDSKRVVLFEYEMPLFSQVGNS